VNRAWEECCVGRGVAAIRSGTPSAVFYALRAAESIWEPFQQEGTVFGAINKSDLAKAKVPWPEAGQLPQLEATLAVIDDKIRSQSVEIIRLEELRDTLLPELLSGRICVPETCKPVDGAVA
jgi:type I restriction enzyme S subunit